MAEDQNTEKEGGTKSSGIIKTLILFSLAMIVPAITGLLVYNFWVKPRLTVPPPKVVTPVDEVPPFPVDMQTVVFDDMNISVQTDDPDLVAPILIMQMALSCDSAETAAMVTAKKEYFVEEILNLHQGRTRSELNDPLLRNSILEQVKQRANILLKRLAPELDLTILKAMHLKFAVMDIG